jgi:hypothetical protein
MEIMTTINTRSEKSGTYINKFYEILRLQGREKKMWSIDINRKSTVVNSIREQDGKNL